MDIHSLIWKPNFHDMTLKEEFRSREGASASRLMFNKDNVQGIALEHMM